MDSKLLISQIIWGIIIVVLGIYIFKKYKIQFKLKNLVLAALMITILVISSKFISIGFSFFGVSSFKISFTQVLALIVSEVFSLPMAYLMAIITNVVSYILSPSIFSFGFVFNTVLLFMIGNLVIKYLKTKSIKFNRNLLLVLLIVVYSIATIYLSLEFFSTDITKSIYFLPLTLLSLVYMLIILQFLYKKTKHGQTFIIFSIAYLLVEVLINVCLTPFHLNLLFGIPISFSILLRVVKIAILLPVYVSVGSFLSAKLEGVLKNVVR